MPKRATKVVLSEKEQEALIQITKHALQKNSSPLKIVSMKKEGTTGTPT